MPLRQRAPAARLPWVAPQLATLTDRAPAGTDWVHEIKYDGYRLLAYISDDGVRLLTRNQKDWSARFPAVTGALAGLGPRPLLVDGEVAVELESGVTSFQALQNAERGAPRGQLRYFAFDLLYAGGEDLQRLPLIERKSRLERVLRKIRSKVVRYSDHVVGRGPSFFDRACRHGLEGIITKRADAPYRPGRSTDWLKVKCVREQEFVIGGFTEPGGSRSGLGALHVGAFDAAGRLIYRGKVGTGFTETALRGLRRRLDGLRQSTSPFLEGPTGAASRGSHWVEPRLVAQIRFTEWTDDGRLRHPSFNGLREDKTARSVRLEQPKPLAAVTSQAAATGAAPQSSRKRGSPAPKRSSPAPKRSSPAPKRSSAIPRRTSRKQEDRVDVAGVSLSSPSRVVYPAEGITKLELARYYERIGEDMLPYVRGRPLTLIRCPDTIEECFFQKHIDESRFYDRLDRVPVREEKGVRHYPAVRDVSGLISLVQLGVVEFHTLGSRQAALERPDRLTLDLDPDPSVPWKRVVRAARVIRDLLSELGLTSFVKTTGGKGLHVVAPLQRRSGWEDVRAFSRAVAALLVEAAPDEYTLQVSKARRRGRILIDYLRNARGAVAVEAYSARARAGAPVSLPLSWDEVGRTQPGRLTIRSVPRRLSARRADPWRDYFRVRQSITSSMKRSVGL